MGKRHLLFYIPFPTIEKYTMKRINYIIFALTLLCSSASGQQMKISIDGEITFDNSKFIITEAGENFPSNLESESSVFINIENTDIFNEKSNPNEKWSVSVQKADSWNPDLQLEIKRTGDGFKSNGKGNPNIKDGLSYQTISNTPTYFFRGKSEISLIPISIKLTGPSVTLGAKQFESNIFFTVTDEW